ncbi:MAG: hypothetical protein LBK46_03865 [Oscillospiraceae bacterium]|nr:hypothetical protein [Oscillospiraceae bacterium]
MIQVMQRLKPASSLNLIFSVPPTQTRVVEFDGRSWDEYLIDQTCEMTVSGVSSADCAVWLCGGGGGGGSGWEAGTDTNNQGGAGGGGGRCGTYANIHLASGSIVIGAGGGGGLKGATVVADCRGQDGGVTQLSMTGQADRTADGGGGATATFGGNGGSGGGAGYYAGSGTYIGSEA